MSAIYTEIENLVKSTFSGHEKHQELRKKIISLPVETRQLIKDAAAARGCQSKKNQVAEAVYWIIHDLKREPLAICPTCGKEYRGKYYSIIEGYHFHEHCSVSCRNRNPRYVAKLETTNLERHGHRNNMHGAKIRAKTKQKWIEKYGVTTPIQCEQIKAKVRATNQLRRGVDWPAQDKLVLEKYKATMMERHGVDNSFKTGNSQRTCMERYGVPNPMMHPEIFRKTLRGLKSTKQETFPSGQPYTYQGYENVAVQKLLEFVNEDEMLVGDPTKLPVIEYINPVKGKICRYFPDIWVPHLNLIVEVKSTWTMKRQMQENMAKHNAALRLGFKHEIWICSKDQVLEILI